MSIYDQLNQRTDLHTDDVEEIVSLAEQLQQQALQQKERSLHHTDLKKITRELDIADKHVQEAIKQIKQRKKQ